MRNSDDMDRLAQVGLIMESMGITTVQLAEKLKEHLVNCPGGKKCIEKLLEADTVDNL